MDASDCPDLGSRALAPLASQPDHWRVDPELQQRLHQIAADTGAPLPSVMPGALTRILPVALPLRHARQRRATLPFAVEDQLCQPLDRVHLALGPQLASGDWLCVAVDRAVLDDWPGASDAGPLLPDTLAVPVPVRAEAWAVRCGTEAVHLRTADGGGCVCRPDAFAELWRLFGAPPLELYHGTLPPGISGPHDVLQPPPVEPGTLAVDLRPDDSGGTWRRVGPLARFTLGAALVTGMALSALLWADARALNRVWQDRTGLLQTRLDGLGIDLDAQAPARLILAQLAQLAERGQSRVPEPFLTRLVDTVRALPRDPSLGFRDMRYDAAAQALTIQIEAGSLEALQSVETALRQAGLPARAGAATRQAAGADMQIVIAGGG